MTLDGSSSIPNGTQAIASASHPDQLATIPRSAKLPRILTDATNDIRVDQAVPLEFDHDHSMRWNVCARAPAIRYPRSGWLQAHSEGEENDPGEPGARQSPAP